MPNPRTIYVIDTSTGTDDTTNDASGGTNNVGIAIDKNFIVPNDRVWRILNIEAAAISAGAVGNRQLALQIDRAASGDTQPYVDVRAGVTQAASLTYYYSFHPFATRITSIADTDWVSTPIPDVDLPEGWKIRIFDEAKIGTTAAPDDIEIRMLVQQWGMKEV